MSERTPSWGITPVPERLRTLGGVENGMLWSSLGLSLLVLVAGTLLVPALSLPEALLAILVGAIFGNALLGGAAAIGAEAGVPAMVLLRAPLGRAGSYLPTGLNVLQNVGWTIFEVLVIATAAQALVHGPLWVWKLAAARGGDDPRARRPDRIRPRVGEALRALGRPRLARVPDLVDAARRRTSARSGRSPGKGGLSFWQGVDLVIAMPVVVAPARRRLHALLAEPPRRVLGAGGRLLRPERVAVRARRDPAARRAASADAPLGHRPRSPPAASGPRSRSSRSAIDETKEPFANIYSAAVSLQNVVPRVPQRLLILVVAAVATGGAFVIDLVNYQSFLYLLGSFFVPLFGVLARATGSRRATRDAVSPRRRSGPG